MMEEVKRPARRIALLAIGAALAIVGVTAFLFTRSSGTGPHANARGDAAVQTQVATPDAAQVTIVVDAMATPKGRKVSIETTPSGAAVIYNGTTYKTPFELELPVDDGTVELAATLNGYLPGKLVIAPGETAKKLTLKKRTRATPTGTSDERLPF